MLSRNRIKYIQSLSRKKDRDAHQRFIAETPKVVNEFLNSSYKAEFIFATRDWLHENDKQIPAGAEVVEINEEALKKISLLKSPHAVLAVFEMPVNPDQFQIEGQLAIAVDDLQDPGNLGTILRIADWFGTENVFCSPDTVSMFNPKVVQASMGSLAHVTVRETDLAGVLREAGVPVYAATLDGESLFEIGRFSEGILLIGNEGKGIREELLALATHQVSIPGFGRAESLNAAVATGIIVSHLKKVQVGT